MNRSAFAATVVALVLLATTDALAASAAGPARRQLRSDREGAGVEGLTMLRLHGGLTSPTGDLGDAFDGGLGIGADIAHGVSRSLFLVGGVAYHSFDGDGFAADASIVPITFGVATLLPSSGTVRPWLAGGIGFYDIDMDFGTIQIPTFGLVTVSDSETNFGFNFGAGFGAPAGERGAWGAGIKFHHVFDGDLFDDLDFLTVQVGYGFYL
jgi:hypothetical protein